MQYCFVFMSNYFLVITVLAYNQFSPRTISRECINCCLILSRNKITCLYNKWRNNTWREMVLDETGHTQVWPWKFFLNNLVIAFECFISDFEIPDDDAERLMTPALIIEYICDKEDTYEWKGIYRYITGKIQQNKVLDN